YRLFKDHSGPSGGARPPSPEGPSFGLDVDLARLGRFVLRQLNQKDAVLEAGVHLVGIDRERQRNGSAELTEVALLPVPDAFLDRRRLALALQRQLIAAGDVDFQVLPIEARQLGLDKDRIVVLPHVERRVGRGQTEQSAAVLAPTLKGAVHLPL